MKSNNHLCLLCVTFTLLTAGCCSVFHINCPEEDYWSKTDAYANQLNKRYGNQYSQIVPLPLGDYEIGTAVDNGSAVCLDCIFPGSAVTNVTADERLAAESNTVSFNISLQSPTNISTFTAGFNVDASGTVYVNYSHMSLHQLDPSKYIPYVEPVSSECKTRLAQILSADTNTLMIVGYLVGQVQMSQTKNFDIDLNGAAYGASGKLAYTNSSGWTVLSTNPVNCFALVTKPAFTSGGGGHLALTFPAHYSVIFNKPKHKSALASVSPLIINNEGERLATQHN